MTSTTTATALAEYERRTPTSGRLFDDAKTIVAGGVSRATLAFEPYPFYAESAHGSTIIDVDGNRYLDLVNNYTSLPHGHGHPASVLAFETQLRSSSAMGVAHPLEAIYAKELSERIPAMERIHFTTTGSEAAGFTLRVARANTNRQRILKFEGGFHGSHNELYQDIAVLPALAPGTARPSRPASSGLEPSATITAVYNDVESVIAAFAEWGHEIAAVIVEPFLGNGALITATSEFLDQVFASAHNAGALVIFDEIQSLRAGYSGAEGLWGYTPDLVAVGKIMGGGHALAAFGGRRDLFDVLAGDGPQVLQTGTFTATAPALAAGRAAMDALTTDAYDELNVKAERLREGIVDAFKTAKIPIHVNGLGSMFNISISNEPVTSFRTHLASDAARFADIRLQLLVRGVLIMPRGTGCLSTAVSDQEIDFALDMLRESLVAHQTATSH